MHAFLVVQQYKKWIKKSQKLAYYVFNKGKIFLISVPLKHRY